MRTIISTILFSFLLAGCNFSKSVKKDLISGLTSKGNLLTCDNVYLTVNNEKTTSNSFIYGEMIYMVFNDIQGFTKENGNVFPLMDLVVTGISGDTVLFADNIYSDYNDGMDFTPLQLTANISIVTPIRSGGEYTLSVKIRDRKSEGTFSSVLKFTVKANDKIKTEAEGTTFDEIYLFSQGKDKVITDGKINFDDNIYIMVEGLKGFTEENGLVYPGLSLYAFDSGNDTVLKNDNLFSEYSEKGVAVSDFTSRVSAHFKFSGTEFNNPLLVEIIVWDKKSNSKIKVESEFELE